MKNILLINSSPHGAGSHAYQVAKDAIARAGLGEATLTERDLVAAPIPPLGRDYAMAITSRTPPDAEALALSERLIVELEQSDMLFILAPIHNFTVPAALKLWLDHVIRINRSFTSTPQGKVGNMTDRPTFVLVSSGSFHVGERARQADFFTPYLRYALASIGIGDVHFIPMEALVFGPDAVAQAVEAAHRQLQQALAGEAA